MKSHIRLHTAILILLDSKIVTCNKQKNIMSFNHIIDRDIIYWNDIKISRLENRHLENIINYLKRYSVSDLNNSPYINERSEKIFDPDYIALLETELIYRLNNDIVVSYDDPNKSRGFSLDAKSPLRKR